DVLLREASKYGIDFQFQSALVGLEKNKDKFELQLSNGKSIEAFYCCLACGGMNKESSFDWLRQLGHTIIKPVPSLFTFNCPGHSLTGLMGVVVPMVKVKISGTKLEQTGPVLITHWGLSGPAVLRLSAWGARLLQEKEYQFTIQLNWLEGEGWNSASVLSYFEKQRQEHPSQQLTNSRMFQLPQRLWDYFLTESGIAPQTRFADLKKKDENKLIKLLTDMVMDVSGKTTFKEEFVTAGGIDCAEIDATTMQSKLVPGLYFAGEIMDVDGITGGFNFQHAWSSGYLAALSMATK
ncbi:MAG: aminoacetone oxidase family FAD-binding enzyme, partial [Chitinophagia bacterium]|nr:aminoacetone oxidase family FAD-binding enzyme [Chitinophagia bacterium]